MRAGHVEQPVDAALGDRADLGGGDRQEVGGERRAGRRGSCRSTRPARRAAPSGCRSPSANSSRPRRGRNASTSRAAPDHLGRAAQRVRILHPGVVRSGATRRSPSPPASARRLAALVRLPGLGPQRVQIGGERLVGAQQRLDRTSPRRCRPPAQQHARGPRTPGPASPSIPSVPLISARPSLAVQLERLDAGRRQRRRAPGAEPAVGSDDLALADQRQRAVGQGGEVAARAERAVLGNDRSEAGVRAGRAAPRRQPGRTPEQPMASDRARSSIIARTTSRSTGGPMPAAWDGQRSLQLAAAAARDPDGRQRAEAGRDPVDRLLRFGARRHHRGAALHFCPGRRAQHDASIVAGHGDHVGRAHSVRSELQSHEADTRAPGPGRTSTAPDGAGNRAASARARGRRTRRRRSAPPPRRPACSHATVASTAGVETS